MYSKIVSTLLGKSKHKETVGHAPDPAHCCQHCGRAQATASGVNDYDDLMLQREYQLKWNVKFLGSFPISSTSVEHVSYRLERFQPLQITPVTLNISLINGVRVYSDDDLILAHPLRRISSVVSHPTVKQVAYIAQEPAGQTYRRQCHVFRTEHPLDVEEIESVLGNAFQAALARQNMRSAVQLPPKTLTTPKATMSEKRVSSTAFLSRFMGRAKEEDDEKKAKRKRRPVSAVFSALQRFSSSSAVSHKRMTSFEPLCRETPVSHQSTSPVPEEPIPPPTVPREKENRLSKATETPSLVFDERLNEMIIPIEETVEAQLENVNYFVKLPTRELLSRNLLSQPEGSFVVRYSESKRRCLALSMRVPLTHNPAGISHYLIIRNEQGYRIRGFSKTFASLPMLVTHHSVLQEQLPVPLHLVQWNKADWQQQRVPLLTDDWQTPKRRSRHSRFINVDC